MRRWISIFAFLALFLVGADMCGGGGGGGTTTTLSSSTTTTTAPVQAATCLYVSNKTTNTLWINGQLGSDTTAINNSTPLVSLAGDGGLATYNVKLDSTSLGQVKTLGVGSTICIQLPNTPDGQHTLIADEVSPHAGLQAKLIFKIDTVAPSAPAITSCIGVTQRISCRGTANPSGTVRVYKSTPTLIISGAAADSSGNWVATSTTQTSGAYKVFAIQADTAGNVSEHSNEVQVTVP